MEREQMDNPLNFIRDVGFKKDISETDVVVKFVAPFMSKILGFNKFKEIRYEVPIWKIRADAVCYIDNIPVLPVEVKSPKKQLFTVRKSKPNCARKQGNKIFWSKYLSQVMKYNWGFETRFSFITNGRQLVIFDKNKDSLDPIKLSTAKISDFHKIMRKNLKGEINGNNK